ncbi:hypothetical protein BEL05_06785 [Shewanella colwelliana]|uniref:VanZ-like domain-containing protein n=1 Tax=Shewanella colwelliana TaxID=23 RepID=A0A1E5IRC4_SHECO|nr:hypothetical protein BEL05_06785 [Shewanella colwelliana]GIU44220.1 hypothetical protein TUM3794_31720 [Shewanella colwelliana]
MVRLFAGLSVLFSLFLGWIIFSADTGQSNLFFELIRHVPYGDKWGHLLLFGTLTLLVTLGTNFKRVRLGGFSPYLGAIAVAVIVLIEECSQAYFPQRTFDLFDLLADAIGILMFSWLSYLIEIKRQKIHTE